MGDLPNGNVPKTVGVAEVAGGGWRSGAGRLDARLEGLLALAGMVGNEGDANPGPAVAAVDAVKSGRRSTRIGLFARHGGAPQDRKV
jgi:hypothetical protein